MTSAAFVIALQPLLEARAAFIAAGAMVEITEPPPDRLKTPCVILVRGSVEHSVAWLAMRRRDDDVVVPGRVLTKADDLEAAATQAEALITEIAHQLYDAPPIPLLDATISRIGWEPVASRDTGWIVNAEYDITYRAEEVL